MLNRLDIQNFRILKDLHVEQLGQVNLIVGKNNAGKSTVLEAVRVFAGNGQRRLLEEIAREHDETFWSPDPDAKAQPPKKFSFDFLFNNPSAMINIGDFGNVAKQLSIENVILREVQETYIEDGISHPLVRRRRVERLADIQPDDVLRSALAITKNGKPHFMLLDTPIRTTRLLDQELVAPCGIVPTHLGPMDELAQAWDRVVFSDDENLIKQAIKFIAPDFEALTFIDIEDYQPERQTSARPSRHRSYRIPVVKSSGAEGPRPLKSLGDGVSRVLQLALKLVQSKNGYLLIDEFENGFHYTVQETIWKYLFRAASAFNIQVFATTHSWDCVRCFAQAAREISDVDGLLFRVGRSVRTSDAGRVIATPFYGEDLYRVSQSDLEVR